MSADAPHRRFDPVRLLTTCGALALALMLFWTMLDIGGRLAFSRPLHGTLDLVEITLVLVAFLALPECFRRDEQIKVDVFDAAVGPRGLAIVILLGEIATLAFLALLAATLVSPLADAYRFGDLKPDLPVPIYMLLAAIELALVVSALVMVGHIVTHIKALPGRRAAAPEPALNPSNGAAP